MSEHFKISEFACHDGTPYPLEWVDTRLTPLCEVLEEVRYYYAGPLIVVSGYRPPAYNTKIGGAKASQHMEGRAADVRPVHLEEIPMIEHIVKTRLAAGSLAKLGGWGVYPGWLHFDVRERPANGHVAFWTGSGIGSELA